MEIFESSLLVSGVGKRRSSRRGVGALYLEIEKGGVVQGARRMGHSGSEGVCGKGVGGAKFFDRNSHQDLVLATGKYGCIEVRVYPAECGEQLGRDPSKIGSSESLVLRSLCGERTHWDSLPHTLGYACTSYAPTSPSPIGSGTILK